MSDTLVRGRILDVGMQLVSEICCDCHIPFAMPTWLRKQLMSSHEWFYCPNGHKQHYTGKSEETKQRERAERAERELADARTRLHRANAEITSERRSAAAYKGQVTKLRNRIANGVCPVPKCRRHFDSLGEHMKHEHPGYVDEHPALKEAMQ